MSRFRGTSLSGRLSLWLALSSAFLLCSCDRSNRSRPEQTSESETPERLSAEATGGEPAAGPVPAAWVSRRVAEARDRLGATEAGDLVWQSIQTHGGLDQWLAQGTLAFEFDYQPLGAPESRRHTSQKIDLWRARAVHQELSDEGDEQATFGWDGERAWIAPNAEAFPSSPRFWALTPYYFVGMPFVLADPGTHHELFGTAELDGETHRLVKVTFGEGVGDSPGDYYILYIHPESYELAALRYVVAYPGLFAHGEHSPEKLMRYTDYRRVGELQLASTLDTYAWHPADEAAEVAADGSSAGGSVGEKVTSIAVRDFAMGAQWPGDTFAPIDGAEVSTTIEAVRP